MTGKELASYYRAAVEYIDPRLREDCPVEDICAAAKARQRALRAHDSDTARLEHEKIEEALQFIRRVHPDVVDICREQGDDELQACDDQAEYAMDAAPQQAAMQASSTNSVTGDDAAGMDQAAAAASAHLEQACSKDAYGSVLLSSAAADADADEMVELVFGSGLQSGQAAAEHAQETEAAANGAEEFGTDYLSGEASDAEPESTVPVDAEQPAGDFPAGESEVTQPAALAEPTEAEAPPSGPQAAETGQPDSEGAARPAGDAGSELAAAMAAPRQTVDVPNRHQFIAQLRERRRNGGQDLPEDEARQLISELRAEQHSEQRISELISRVPDVGERMQQELQHAQESSQPLDFRSMMQLASADKLPPVRPASRPRLKTEAILSREKPARRIPEEHAAPVLLGILMILWQFSAALLAGFALSRILIWHFGTAFSTMTPVKAMFTCLIGVGSAALIGVGFRIYRLRSHKLSLPVHVTALSFLLLLLAWQFSANANAYTGAPPLWLWCMLLAAWLVATIAAGLHDLRVPPVTPAEEGGIVPAKPVAPLAN